MKSIFIPWSGGLDSTYLIYKNLIEGNNVHTSSFVFLNNIGQSLIEYKAKKMLIPILEEIAAENNVNFKYNDENNFYVKLGNSSNILGQLPLISIGFRYLNYSSVDEVQFGYVQGDCLFDENHEFEKLLIQNFNNNELYNFGGNPINLSLPLKETNKTEIIKNLPSELLELVSWCEEPRINDKQNYDDLIKAILFNSISDDILKSVTVDENCSCTSCGRMNKAKSLVYEFQK